MNGHLGEIKADSFEFIRVLKTAFFVESLKIFVASWCANFEADRLEDLKFFELELFLSKLIMANFVHNCSHVQRNDIFVLGGDEHGCDSADVEFI